MDEPDKRLAFAHESTEIKHEPGSQFAAIEAGWRRLDGAWLYRGDKDAAEKMLEERKAGDSALPSLTL